jgi:hypothetical protein
MVGREIPKGFIAGPDSPEYELLCRKEIGRLLAVYCDHVHELRVMAAYRQFLADLTYEALAKLEGER